MKLPAESNQKVLVERLLATEGRCHAVVDGAQFHKLPNGLTNAGLYFRQLYLGESAQSGPHLVHPMGRAQVERLLKLVGDQPAVVWWDWPDEQDNAADSLYKHLRRLGMIEIPASKLPLNRGEQLDTLPEYRSILFRHADPRVLSITLPELSTKQMATFMGSAYRLLFEDPETGIVEKIHPEIEKLPWIG